MNLKNLISNYADSNLWANKTFADWLKTKPEEMLNKEVASSYETIKKTFMHIWDTERFWLSFLQTGITPTTFESDFEGTTSEIFDEIVKHSESFAEYVDSLSDADLLEECTLNAPWMKGKLPRYEYIQHCFNHGTYHRGQIITMGRIVGFTDPPMTDYNFYNMAVKKPVV